nr:follistatin-like isoform X1 [Lytechinus pictus]
MRRYNQQVFAIISIWTFCGIQLADGGVCWSSPQNGNPCSQLVKLNISQEECCHKQGPTISWSSQDLDLGNLMRKLFTSRISLSECIPCRGESVSDTCEEMQCRDDQKCILDSNNRTRCICQPRCDDIQYDGPVCGTDNFQYRSICDLRTERCHRSSEVEVAYYGRCQRSCDGVTCPRGRRCVEDQTGRPHCVLCWAVCSYPIGDLDYACGRDQITYESRCHLRLSSCLMGRAVGIAHRGRCENFTTCSALSCVRGKQCVMDYMEEEPRCVLCNITCPERWLTGPVCGSDGVTYPTQCHLHNHMCANNTYVFVDRRSPCNVENTNSIEETGSIDHTTFLDIVEPIAVPLGQVNKTERSALLQRSNAISRIDKDLDVTTEIIEVETTIVTEIEDVQDPLVVTDGDGRDGEGSSNKRQTDPASAGMGEA